MSRSESLTPRILPSIFHEVQEPDTSLCAQHALNNLLQGSYYSAADLAELGRQLDNAEEEARGGAHATAGSSSSTGNETQGGRRRQSSPPAWGRGQAHLNADRSRNMDDSGFFSSQVMDQALTNFNLQLVRWRSERCRSMQGAPEEQSAFVFNLSSHWFALRRFGRSKHFWYDLNSFHTAPKHVSPLYLGLQIDQAEHEGYSVFVVLPSTDDSASEDGSFLPRCDADSTVYALADEQRVQAGLSSTSARVDRATTAALDDETLFTSSGNGPAFNSLSEFSAFSNEDEELNRAIEASLQQSSASTSRSTLHDNAMRTADALHDKAHEGDPLHKRTEAGAFDTGMGPTFDNQDPELAAAIAASLEMEQARMTAQQKADEEEQAEEARPLPASLERTTSARDGPYSQDNLPPTMGVVEPSKLKEVQTLGKEKDREDSMDPDGPSDEEEEEEDGEEPEEQERAPTAEEIRKMRLARFG